MILSVADPATVGRLSKNKTSRVFPMRWFEPRQLQFLYAALLALAVPAVGLGQEPVQKLAFLVGVSDYDDESFEDLKYADNDATVTALQLEAMGFETKVLTNSDATRERINRDFEAFLRRTERLETDAVVFILFSGHGQQLKTSAANRVEETPFFCPHDAKGTAGQIAGLAGKSSPEVAESMNLVSLNEILAELNERSNSLNNLIVVDACRNNPAKGKAPGITGSTARDIPNGVSLLFAARSGQRSWESADPEIKNGVFSHYLIRALQGEAKNRRGNVTWSGVATYVSEEVSYEGWKIAGDRSRRQNAQAVINSDGVVVMGSAIGEESLRSLAWKSIWDRERLMRLADLVDDRTVLKWPMYYSFVVPSPDSPPSEIRDQALAWYGDQIHDDSFAELLSAYPQTAARDALEEQGIERDQRESLVAQAVSLENALGKSIGEPLVEFLTHLKANSQSDLVRLAASFRLFEIGISRLPQSFLDAPETELEELKLVRQKLANLVELTKDLQDGAAEDSDQRKYAKELLTRISVEQGSTNERLNELGFIGWEFPEIEQIDLYGKPMKLSQFRGQAVILDLWAYW